MNLLPDRPTDRLATGVLLFSATLWGLTWMPLKAFVGQGLAGPVVSLLTYGSVGLLALVLLWRDRLAWRSQWALVLGLVVVGGWANTSFVNAVMLGDVARVMFLFYLSPVWSVLGGWLFLKERIPPLRWAAVVMALVGLWLFLGGTGGMDLAFSFVDFLALSAGFCFAANNVIALNERFDSALTAHTLDAGAKHIRVVMANMALIGDAGQPAGTRQHTQQRDFRQGHTAGAVVNQHDVVAGQGQFITTASTRAIDSGQKFQSAMSAAVFQTVACFVGEFTKIHLPRMG